MKLNWQCPYCNRYAIVTDSEDGTIRTQTHVVREGCKYGFVRAHLLTIVCPNDECREVFMDLVVKKFSKWPNDWDSIATWRKWRLMPESNAKPFPSYIPAPIMSDYREAALICTASPKASATLARRCLQGMIRDFWGVVDKTLSLEIDAIKDKISTEDYKSIDALRHLGNIGAHMEKDINLIVDVDESEAQLLLELIETLIEDWYVARHDRQARNQTLQNVLAQKKQAKTGTPGQPVAPLTGTPPAAPTGQSRP
jgi:hypothetical protein